jgi:hypothetical protein
LVVQKIIDSFIVGAYWGFRAESLSEVASKILQTLMKLKEIDALFFKYFEQGWSTKKALEREVVLDDDYIKKLCRRSVKKNDLDKNEVAKHGFIIGLWTGQKDVESGSIMFIVGHAFGTVSLSNSCVLNIPFEGPARNRLLRPEVSKKIIEVMVNIWSPDYAVLISHSLREKLNDGNNLGFITYRKDIKILPVIGNDIVYKMDKVGHWFYVGSIDGPVDDIANKLLPLKDSISSSTGNG